MKLPRRRKPAFVEVTVASDLAFLLIIYFIVIAGFNVNMGFLVNLPARDSTRLILREDLLRFEMDGEGRLTHESGPIEIAQARTLISSAREAKADIAVILTIDPGAGWQDVVSFVEVAQSLRIEAFSFSMRRDAR